MRALVLQLPSPPGLDVNRDYAGGHGVATHVHRSTYGHTGGGFELMPNVVLSHATGVLREAGHDVGFCDGQVERHDLRDVLDRVGAEGPDLLVTCLNLPSLDADRALLRAIRDAFPRLPIVATGTVCKTIPDDALEGGLVDLAPMAEEERVIELAARCVADGRSVTHAPGGLAWKDGGLVATGPAPRSRPLDELPFPAYDLLPMKSYTMGILGRTVQYAPIYSSRGCPYPCSYCPYPVGLGSRVGYRSPGKVVREIEIVHDMGAEGIIFRDQTFTLDRKHASALCKDVVDRNLDIQWICETRVDLVTRELLRAMRAAGCRGVNYGMETGDPDLLRRVGKPGATIEDLRAAVDLTRKAGLLVQVHLIVGLPGETWETIERTLRTLFDLRVDNADFNIITPYPGTKLYQYARENGLITSTAWSEFTSVDPVMRTEAMTVDELKEAQRYLNWAFRRQAPFATRWARRWRLFLHRANKVEAIRRFASRQTDLLWSSHPRKDEVLL